MKNPATQNLLKLLKIQLPLIQAPMAGGITTPEFIAAVSNEGCLGSMGAGYLSADQLAADIKKTQALTSQPFAVNLFIPEENKADPEKISAMQKKLNLYRQKLNIPLQENIVYENPQHLFEKQMDVVLTCDVPVFSFTFGIPDKKYLQALRKKGVIIIGTATNIDEAKQLAAAGCDAVVAQGYEAGGHRGTFTNDTSHALLGLMAFIPQLADEIHIPIIASGGIMDARGIKASLALGAAAVQMGTALLTCSESGASETYKKVLLAASGNQTQLTRAFSGKMARGIENKFTQEMENDPNNPGYPIQHCLTKDIRAAAAEQENPEYLSLWAGQGVGGKHQKIISVKQMIEKLKND